MLHLFFFFCAVDAGLILHNPRGSNNKLSEQSNTVDNDHRLFDSGNSPKSGYQIGDKCDPVCQDGTLSYDANVPGAMEGMMYFYQGSELYIEWTASHGCGLGNPDVICQMILQYMCESDNPDLRDGYRRGKQNTAGGEVEPPNEASASDLELGQHEPLDFYLDCRLRERNRGLYTADQDVVDSFGATATRQNPDGNAVATERHGLECPEERDYYPYWHPTPWHDIAIFTDEPEERCHFYESESQNVQEKGFCNDPQFNNPAACEANGASWQVEASFNEDKPKCFAGVESRANHYGNVRMAKTQYYLWNIPEQVSGRCVLRMRYNVTPGDFREHVEADSALEWLSMKWQGVDSTYFDRDSQDNDPTPGRRRRTPFIGEPPILPTDPIKDFIGLGEEFQLQLSVDTRRFGRTFQDRTHTFEVKPLPEVAEGHRVVNFNVRGRRGTVEEVFPAVVYDFVPNELTVEASTFIHFQWTGSDANALENTGAGRAGTDRSNLVQLLDRLENVPSALEEHTLFFDGSGANEGDRDRLRLFSYLNQEDSRVSCNAEDVSENSVQNCKQLNAASAYFDGGLIQMDNRGVHHVMSTRNNEFATVTQKATITVTREEWEWWEIFVITLTSLLAVMLLIYFSCAAWGWMRPASVCFSHRHRPRILNFMPADALRKKEEQRRALRDEKKLKLMAEMRKINGDVDGEDDEEGEDEEARKERAIRNTRKPQYVVGTSRAEGRMAKYKFNKGRQFLESRNVDATRTSKLILMFLNVSAFIIGFFSNVNLGFQGGYALATAKGAGYALDLDFAIIVLPVLRSLQTALRGGGGAQEWLPFDDPHGFHIWIAKVIAIFSGIHIAAHIVRAYRISLAAVIQPDPLGHFDLSEEELLAGTSILDIHLDVSIRCAPISGWIVLLVMGAMYATAAPCARRQTNFLTKKYFGYNVFWQTHKLWIWVYVLLLIHAPARLWIWFFFPAIFVLVDRGMLMTKERPYAALISARLLPFDVISLVFELPKGFVYSSGQYLLVGWKGEWHPFTISSCPEESVLSVHIRAPNANDWCSALRRRLIIEAPQGMAEGTAETTAKAKPGTWVSYDVRYDPVSKVLYNRPREDDSTQKDEARVTVESSSKGLPNNAVVLQLAGPFGAPAQRVWEFNVLAVVGGGIGVTPFVSILRSVQLRVQHRNTLLAGMRERSGGVTASTKHKLDFDESIPARFIEGDFFPEPEKVGVAEERAERVSGVHSGPPKTPAPMTHRVGTREILNPGVSECETLLNNIIRVPEKVHFYWIVRNQGEFDWFYDLLMGACEGPAKSIIEVNLYHTAEMEVSQIKQLPNVHSQTLGRPKWDKIFQKLKKEHERDHIGVFLCGNPIIGQALATESKKNSDPLDKPNCTRFSFFQETF